MFHSILRLQIPFK